MWEKRLKSTCTLNYNNLFVSLLWGNFRFVESWRLRANNDIKLFHFYVLLIKCLIYQLGSLLVSPSWANSLAKGKNDLFFKARLLK